LVISGKVTRMDIAERGDSTARPRLGLLVQDPGNPEHARLGGRSIGQQQLGRRAWTDLVGAEGGSERKHRGGGRDLGSVYLCQASGVVQDGRKLLGVTQKLFLAQLEAGKLCDFPDFLCGKSHFAGIIA